MDIERLHQGMVDAATVPSYVAMIETLRATLDDIAGAIPDEAAAAVIDAELRAFRERLRPMSGSEAARRFGRIRNVAGRGQAMSPAWEVIDFDGTSLRARVTFGRYFLGGNGAAHGGAIALLFDEVLGLPANADVRRMARTARLTVNFRAITPVDVPLEVTARLVASEGRKRTATGELRHGDILCAEADGLFVELLPGQQ